MAIRTDGDTVKAVITTSLSAAEVLATFIPVASDMVDELDDDTDMDDTRLTNIETWLTAHLIAMSKERQAVDEKLGDATVKYGAKLGMHLEATTYGQVALQLDTSGTLKRLGKETVKVRAIKSFNS